jgi:hypothetical protein
VIDIPELDGTESKLASHGWKQFMDDVESAQDKIHLYQLVSKHVRGNSELRNDMYSTIDILFGKIIKKRELAEKVLEDFYMELLEAKAKFFDGVGHSGQLGLAVAEDGVAMKPPIDPILNSIFDGDK